jgi:hypothetical protein
LTHDHVTTACKLGVCKAAVQHRPFTFCAETARPAPRASLAFFLKRVLDHELAGRWPEISSTDAIAAMRSVGLAELSIAGRTARLVGRGGRDAQRLVKTLSIGTLNPPPESPRRAK